MRATRVAVACVLVLASCTKAPEVVLLGDSIMVPLGSDARVLNLARSGHVTAQILERAKLIPASARHVIVEGGVNDMLHNRALAEIRGNYAALLSAIPPAVSVHVLGIIPIDEPNLRKDFAPYLAPDKVAATNAALRELCAARANCAWLALEALETSDGIHPTPAGLALLRNAIAAATR